MCVCVCVCVCERERERERENLPQLGGDVHLIPRHHTFLDTELERIANFFLVEVKVGTVDVSVPGLESVLHGRPHLSRLGQPSARYVADT